MSFKHVNVVVIGSGAGGGIVAKELSEAGLDVVLLERGRWVSPDQERKDDLRNQRTTALGVPFGPDEEKEPRVFVDPNGKEKVVWPADGNYNNNAACVGGGTVSYGAMAWRYMEQDFRMRSIYGTPKGSTLTDWPISYSDLEPFYEKAEWEIGVAGDQSADPFKARRRRALPMPPLPDSNETRILKPAAQKLGWHPFYIPMLRNTIPYNGRPGCMRCRWCCGYACECDAKCGTQNTVIPKAIASGRCELRTRCIAGSILLDSRGQAKGVEYFDSQDRRQVQTADLVVVSGGAIESARLLLNSRSSFFPNGIGNRFDWVGRNLQGHAYSGAFGLFDQNIYDDLGPGAEIAICDFNHGNPGLTGGMMLANEFCRVPYQVASMAPPGVPKWGKAHKDFMRTWFRRSIVIMGPSQEMPVFDSRVQVDPKVRDHWGLPVARLSGMDHPHNIDLCKFASDKAELWLKEAGAIQTVRRQKTQNWLSGGQHQAGTCRMGNDPKTSVVDRHCRVHDINNLFVMDASVHVTNGGFNPVLTIMAIAYYASDHIKRSWSNGTFRAL
ncbi:MAG TPA: GMC family oxidoreductase [Verrucomicrobiae bacterium]|nr:GMC family oxidoreductase [Verrucomicrobiae bacterium]